jgi:hypothetical protein
MGRKKNTDDFIKDKKREFYLSFLFVLKMKDEREVKIGVDVKVAIQRLSDDLNRVHMFIHSFIVTTSKGSENVDDPTEYQV